MERNLHLWRETSIPEKKYGAGFSIPRPVRTLHPFFLISTATRRQLTAAHICALECWLRPSAKLNVPSGLLAPM
jgi:hypothetical protein